MKLSTLVLALLGYLFAGMANAQQPPAAPAAPATPATPASSTVPPPAAAPSAQAELKAASDRLATMREAINQQRSERIAATKAWYTAALDKMQKDAMTRSDPMAALAAKTEAGRLERELTMEEKRVMPEWLRTYRATYERALAQVSDQNAANEIAALRLYVTVLEGLEKRIAQAGDADGAAKVKQECAMVAEQMAGLDKSKKPTPPPVAVVAEPRPPAPSTAPVVAGAIPPSPMNTPKSTPGLIEVAEELKAKSGVKTPGTGVIVFDAPAGDGRRGAKGVFLKNDPQTGKEGTTWSFQYTREGTAYSMQIIHPHGRGQVIVHLHKESISVSLPDNWTEVGWGSGPGKPAVKMSRAAADIFPLQDGEEYVVESKLTGTGGLEVSINGKLVATARVTGASPLSLEIPPEKRFPLSGRGTLEFKGADLPMQWAAGNAGLILGPLDKGTHVCRKVEFKPVGAATIR